MAVVRPESEGDRGEFALPICQAETIFSTEHLIRRSATLSVRMEEISKQAGIFHLDARPYLREGARNEYLHGPRDWKHLNQRGYVILAESIIPYLMPERVP